MACSAPRRIEVRLVKSTARLPANRNVSTSCHAVRIAQQLIGDLAREHFVALYLNTRNCVFAYDIWTSGADGYVAVDDRVILKNAVLVGAIGLISAHQHPSGDPTPSSQDREMWRAISAHAHAMGVRHLDDVVIGSDAYYSRQMGKVESFRVCAIEVPE